MALQPVNVLAIALMAGATYATRALGYAALGHRVLGKRAMAMLEAAPGCVLIAVIAPEFVSPHPADLLALAITLVAAVRLPMMATVAVAILSAAGLRWLMG